MNFTAAEDWVIIKPPAGGAARARSTGSDLPAAIRAIWDLTPDLSNRIEAVHRLSSFGAVVTNTAYGTSPEGFAAEWRVVDLVTVEGRSNQPQTVFRRGSPRRRARPL